MKPYIIVFSLCLFACVSFLHAQDDFLQKPSLHWKAAIKKPIVSSPVVKDNLIYFGGLDSTFYAVDLITGKNVWLFRTKGEIRSTAALADNLILLNGGDGVLYALDAKTGKVAWTFQGTPEKKYDFADYHQSSPVVHGAQVFLGSGSGKFYAVGLSTHQETWSFQAGDAIHSTAAIDQGNIFFGSFDGYVYSLKLKDGSLHWKFKTVGQRYFPKGEVQGSPAVFGGLVFIGSRDFNVYAIDQAKGYCHWNRYLPRGWGLANTIKDSVLYLGTADERTFFAIDPASGKERWSKKMELLVFGSNAYTQNIVYVGTTMGRIHALDRKTGKSIWTFETDGYQKNRLKYFKQDDTYRDDIYSIIKSNEQFVDVQYELGGIFSTPVIQGDYLIFTSTEGSVYCLRK
jgi:outer membrane protein assembly factor BamB